MQRASWLVMGTAAVILAQTALGVSQKADPSASTPSDVISVVETGRPDLNLTWELLPKPPIKFTPFDMVDPATGKPVRPDDWIVIDGVKIKAGEYYRRLNEMERWLNEHGYTLRSEEPLKFEFISPQLQAELADSEARLRQLEASMPSAGEPGEGDFYPAACNGDSRQYDTGWYGTSLFGIRFFARGSFQACYPSPFSASVEGQAVLSGRLASYTRDVASATASATASTTDFQTLNYNYNINVQVLGNTVWGPSGSGTIPLRYTNSWNWQIASVNWKSPTITLGCVYPLGIRVCLDGQVGVQGGLYLAANVDLAVWGQQVSARPYGGLTGWGAAWISVNAGIARAEAGVRGSVNFLSGSLTGTATGNFQITSIFPRFCLAYNFNTQLDTSLTALSGNLEAFARGCIWFFGWRCAEASLQLFRWNGFSWNQTIFSYSNRYSVYCR